MKFHTAVLSVIALSGSSHAFAPTFAGAKPAFFSKSAVAGKFDSYAEGEASTEEFRLKFGEAGKNISPWHDIPLEGETDGTYNMVVEIPKMTKAKMEISTKEEYNPIAQDIKKGKLRDYHGPIFWNYGMFFHYLYQYLFNLKFQ